MNEKDFQKAKNKNTKLKARTHRKRFSVKLLETSLAHFFFLSVLLFHAFIKRMKTLLNLLVMFPFGGVAGLLMVLNVFVCRL